MSFYVYLICSKNNNNKLVSYVGYTNDLKKRLKLHNSSKGAKFTRGKKWKLLFNKKFSFKKDAMQYEYCLKKNRLKREKIKQKFDYSEKSKNTSYY